MLAVHILMGSCGLKLSFSRDTFLKIHENSIRNYVSKEIGFSKYLFHKSTERTRNEPYLFQLVL